MYVYLFCWVLSIKGREPQGENNGIMGTLIKKAGPFALLFILVFALFLNRPSCMPHKAPANDNRKILDRNIFSDNKWDIFF